MLELIKSWEETQCDLKTKMGDTIFATWIAPLKFSTQDNQSINLEAPDQFFKDWVEKHYLELIRQTLKLRGLNNLLVKLVVSSSPKDLSIPSTDEINIKAAPATAATNLNSRYTFDNFVIGPSNRHAHAYSLAIADSPAKTYNPLFIYGGVGLGKTHLIQAICHQIKSNNPAGVKICYVSSEKFTNELIDAIAHRSTAAFR